MRWKATLDDFCRFCFLAKEEIGTAVYGNRCRRVLRPFFFQWASLSEKPIWAMMSFNGKSSEVNSEVLRSSGERLLEKLEGRLHDSL